MPKIKKTRKTGQIGVRSVPKEERVRKVKEERIKKHNGKPSGSRQNAGDLAKSGNSVKPSKIDPRLGSKKPVPLIAEKKPKLTNKPQSYFSPEQELIALESDPRLESLLNLLDQNKQLNADDQQYVETKMARHKVLCELLNISDDTEEEEVPDTDLFSQFERSNLDKFK